MGTPIILFLKYIIWKETSAINFGEKTADQSLLSVHDLESE